MIGLNLLAAFVIYWHTAHLTDEVAQRKHAGLPVELDSWPTSCPSDGPTSCLPANIGGQSADSAPARRLPKHLAYDSAPYRNRSHYC